MYTIICHKKTVKYKYKCINNKKKKTSSRQFFFKSLLQQNIMIKQFDQKHSKIYSGRCVTVARKYH